MRGGVVDGDEGVEVMVMVMGPGDGDERGV